MNFFLVSLGCPKNLVDTEVIAGELICAGHMLTFDPDEAQVRVINTCAFIPEARDEAFAAIGEGAKWKKLRRGRKLVVAGCLNEWAGREELGRRFPAVDLWVRPDEIASLPDILAGGERTVSGEPCYLYDHNTPRLQLTAPHMAYLKIADGCNNRCSYCAIPDIRGRLRSRDIASVLTEAANLVNNGVRELVVIAQDVTAYGHDRPEDGENLAGLLRGLNRMPGDFVVRLLYTHPAHYTEELIDCLAAPDSRVLPYLDIPLQHISERILREMNRHVGRERVVGLLGELRRRIPKLVLRTTFIVGFPGESEAEFQELLDFVRTQRFERCGVFVYSPEPGTPAAERPDQVPLEVAAARADELMKLQRGIMDEIHAGLAGQVMRVIVDDIGRGVAFARGAMDAPDIDEYVKIALGRGEKLAPGEVVEVRITGPDKHGRGFLKAELRRD